MKVEMEVNGINLKCHQCFVQANNILREFCSDISFHQDQYMKILQDLLIEFYSQCLVRSRGIRHALRSSHHLQK